MHRFQADATTVEQASRDHAIDGALTDVGGGDAGMTGSDAPLGCVWTGFQSDGCACDSRIPADVVMAAWHDHLEQDGLAIDRFFRFTWQDGVWLAYGLKDGRVRGVYCPSHSAQREERSFVADSSVNEHAAEQSLYA